MKSLLLWLAIFASFAIAGCSSRRVVSYPPIPTVSRWQPKESVSQAAAISPVKLLGCAWDYPAVPGITFEVWSSTNLVHWILATNTTERIALFPVKEMEFYKVRARDEAGLVSDWATTIKN